tara:strand:- start:1811 stop:2023 length:213 start_codon:yes stop_codon:yes gene_type:complete
METVKIFFISLFTCTKMEDVRSYRERKNLIRNFKPYKQIQFYDSFYSYKKLDNYSDTDSIHYPNDEVFID